MSDSLIILTDADAPVEAAPDPRLTKIRVVENRFILEEAAKGLNWPQDDLFVRGANPLDEMQWGIIETPLGFIAVDHDGGHLKLPLEAEERGIKILVWSRKTQQPLAENPVTPKHALKHYARQTMPLADFISNRDGMEAQWNALAVTLMSCGVDVEADNARRGENDRNRIITGGSLPMDKKKFSS